MYSELFGHEGKQLSPVRLGSETGLGASCCDRFPCLCRKERWYIVGVGR